MNNDTLQGTVEKIIFHNTESGFSVFVIKEKHDLVTATGPAPTIAVGQHVYLNGTWKYHKKFGKQFEVKTYQSTTPTTILGLKKFLGSGLIKGIGPVYAEKLVNVFGESILDIIEQAPHRLEEVKGIGPQRIEKIQSGWQDHREIARLGVFLQARDISQGLASRIYKKYGAQSEAILLENPYRLAEDIWGIGFKTADLVAQKIGFELTANARIQAGILFTLQQAAQSGQLYTPIDKLKQTALSLLELNPTEHGHVLKPALHNLYDRHKIKVIALDETYFVTMPAFYFTEQSIAQKIQKLKESSTRCTFDLDVITQQLRHADDLLLDAKQIEGIIQCLANKLTVVTGGPGTGKTTLIRKLLAILDAERVTYRLAAPTGRAAKRMMESTNRTAMTIHRLLEFDMSAMRFTYNETQQLKLDFLIIDEASMVDVFLAHAVLKAIPEKAHLVLIGDSDQLPSVGAGNVLHDIILSEQAAYVRLTHIFRQAQDSMIILNAHRINQGEFPRPDTTGKKSDFMFISTDETESAVEHLKEIYSVTLNKHGINRNEAQVLTPMNRGPLGTQALNHVLQEVINPGTAQAISYRGTLYRCNDKVMQIRNNYQKDVYNGDIGIIDSVDFTAKELQVTFPDHTVAYDFDEINELTLAYAITIHKSQGSEFPAVIIPVFMSHFLLLQRNLIYTAVTRATRLCILIGQKKAIAIALRNNKGNERLTLLRQFLSGTQITEL